MTTTASQSKNAQQADWPAALLAARRALGASQRRLAVIARVSRQAVGEWERRGTYPTAPPFARVLIALRRRQLLREFDALIAAAADGEEISQ
jgi:transcriptional regulator with XRE-family HTH domain